MRRICLISCSFISAFYCASEVLAAEPAAGARRTVLDELETEYPSSVRKFQEKLASKGDKVAQHSLGNIYHYGIGVPVDIEQAINWYSQAAESEHVASMNQLKFIEIKQQGFTEQMHAEWYDALVNETSPSSETLSIIEQVKRIRKQTGDSKSSRR